MCFIVLIHRVMLLFYFSFIGPDNAKIVLSCLPLFSIRNETDDSPLYLPPKISATPISPTSAPPKNNGWISFSQSITQEPNISDSQLGTSPELVSEVPIDQELPGDIFTLVDPFEADETDGFNDIEQSTRSQQIDDAFEKATKNDKAPTDEELRGYSDSDDNANNDDDIHINYIPDMRAIKSRTASVSFVTINKVTGSNTLIPTPLPSPPQTLFPRYVERGGWLIKLSHQKGKNKF